MLGQTGCRIEFPDSIIYIDPYLSNSVEDLDSDKFKRLIPIPILPESTDDASYILITHDHLDHCDPHTLPQIARASEGAKFIGPYPVVNKLKSWGISADRIIEVNELWIDLNPDIQIRSIPAAHPNIQRDSLGRLSTIGYLLRYMGELIYFAGDTFASQEIIDVLKKYGNITTAFLPVNEHNFFRDRLGITGNMSIHEAFQFAKEINASNVVATHWDMFKLNGVDPNEISFIYKKNYADSFLLHINPISIPLTRSIVSIVIRTLNESKYLGELLEMIKLQQTSFAIEVVVVDSGSDDGTLDIAQKYGCRICHIKREDFSFGRSLNIGCDNASGNYLVFISGHCIPVDLNWLNNLCKPLMDGVVQYAYGRQIGGSNSFWSESQIFNKYFPSKSLIPQSHLYCNNANSALLKRAWEDHQFDESLTGLEDMELAKRIALQGGGIGYVANATVFHHHNESWPQIRRRFERESIALRTIMPQVHIRLFDAIFYFISSVFMDCFLAVREGFRPSYLHIILYRFNQYYGSWIGNRHHRRLSKSDKDKFFFPY